MDSMVNRNSSLIMFYMAFLTPTTYVYRPIARMHDVLHHDGFVTIDEGSSLVLYILK